MSNDLDSVYQQIEMKKKLEDEQSKANAIRLAERDAPIKKEMELATAALPDAITKLFAASTKINQRLESSGIQIYIENLGNRHELPCSFRLILNRNGQRSSPARYDISAFGLVELVESSGIFVQGNINIRIASLADYERFLLAVIAD
jgi:hypothetical protein